MEAGLAVEAAGFNACFGTEDAQEGLAAFLEKREAGFKGGLNRERKRSRLRRHTRRKIGRAASAPTGPPRYQGKRTCSSQVKRVASGAGRVEEEAAPSGETGRGVPL